MLDIANKHLTYFDNQNVLNAPHVNETVCYHRVLDIEAVQHWWKLRMMDSTDKKTKKQDLGHDYRTYTSFYFWIQIFLTGHEGYKHGLWMGTPLSEAYCLLGNILTSVLAGLFRPCNCHSKRFWWNFVSNSPQPLLNWDPLGWCRHLEKKKTLH